MYASIFPLVVSITYTHIDKIEVLVELCGRASTLPPQSTPAPPSNVMCDCMMQNMATNASLSDARHNKQLCRAQLFHIHKSRKLAVAVGVISYFSKG